MVIIETSSDDNPRPNPVLPNDMLPSMILAYQNMLESKARFASIRAAIQDDLT